jgi:hypothetical protein
MENTEDNDAYSEEERAEKKPKIKALNLTEQQLRERLLTLKNYNLWKKTKAKRINCKELTGDDASPIIHTVASYGSRYGQNEVFLEFISQQEQKDASSDHGRPPFDLEATRGRQSSIIRDRPSFLSYKTDEQEKRKVYRMINQLRNRDGSDCNIKKRRSSTEPKLDSERTLFPITDMPKRKASPFPKELAKLKKKLRILPSLLNRHKTEPAESNPEEENPTISLVSNSEQRSQPIKSVMPFKYSKMSSKSLIYEETERNRSNYLKNIHTILNKSSDLLNGNVPAPSDFDLIRLSSNSYNSALEREKRSESEHLRPEPKQRYLSYWPKYSRYAMTEQDHLRFEQILRKCGQIGAEGSGQNEDVGEMTGIIRAVIEEQQGTINREVLEEERGAFEHKFDYKINLEREKYKRNMKELLRCKKEYRLEKQREEIRANGIKRMKKLGEMDAKAKKNQQALQEKNDQ